ncbi:DUF3095 family protein [Roseivirga sp.]|uniref:DUF3095 family protein n=1 Tax=Roseivirga sp. TaxID=1964215 RepID=UPI002B277C9F|nr:DUF3095 family protein [Roseivirga sp.]
MSDNKFYTHLPIQKSTISQLLSNEAMFSHCPPDWVVITTDIKNSTNSIRNGKHQLVNLIATGSIIAGLNIAHKANIDIPFFFGGDGAAMLVPLTLKKEVLNALFEHRYNTKKNFNLDLRVGSIPVSAIYENGHKIKIAKAQISKTLISPVIVGSGLHYAEKVLKNNLPSLTLDNKQLGYLSLEGMNCRWNEIKAPNTGNEVLSLLVDVINPAEQHAMMAKVMLEMEEIYGDIAKRNPISLAKLNLNPSFTKLQDEIKVKLGQRSFFRTLSASVMTFIGKSYLPNSKKGRRYLENMVESSDTLVIDGRINTVISGTTDQCQSLISGLAKMEGEGQIHFGYHITHASILSCYVRSMEADHVHFVDGIGGGYTQASKMLKSKYQKSL